MSLSTIEVWDLWYPNAASLGLPFARGRLQTTDALLVHAAPDVLRVHIYDERGRVIASALDLRRTADTPIALLSRTAAGLQRVDLWPGEAELGLPVILPGGEVGTLESWWNDDDRRSWRWQVEFYNQR